MKGLHLRKEDNNLRKEKLDYLNLCNQMYKNKLIRIIFLFDHKHKKKNKGGYGGKTLPSNNLNLNFSEFFTTV